MRWQSERAAARWRLRYFGGDVIKSAQTLAAWLSQIPQAARLGHRVAPGDPDVTQQVLVEPRQVDGGAVTGVGVQQRLQQPSDRQARPERADGAQSGGREHRSLPSS